MPSVIISSSGMVTGGRILHHLAQRLPDPRNLILFIGFKAPAPEDSPSRAEPRDEDLRRLCAHSRPGGSAEQFSDHADPPELLQWLQTFKNTSLHYLLVHGEPDASGQLRELMHRKLGWNVQVAQYQEKVELG